MFPAVMYVLYLEKHKMQKIENHDINTQILAYCLFFELNHIHSLDDIHLISAAIS